MTSIPTISIVYYKFRNNNKHNKDPWIFEKIPELLATSLIIIPLLVGSILVLIIALNSNRSFAIIALVNAIPSFMFLILGPATAIESTNNKYTINEDLLAFIGISIGLSFSITFIAFLIGNLINDQSYVPQTFQMLISNVILDGVTLFITIKLLRWSLQKNSSIRIPIVILLDISIAECLACLALYLGLVFTEQQLSITKILYVLIGQFPSGNGTELGPLFWAMHTTFIPTCIYLLFILIGYLGKVIITPTKWFLGKGHEHKSPLGLTSALCALLATIFALAGLATDGLDKHIEKTKVEQSAFIWSKETKATIVYKETANQ